MLKKQTLTVNNKFDIMNCRYLGENMDFYIEKNKQIYNKKYNQNLTFWDFLFWQNFPLQINDKNQIANINSNEQIQNRS